jgi:hypothetical protein
MVQIKPSKDDVEGLVRTFIGKVENFKSEGTFVWEKVIEEAKEETFSLLMRRNNKFFGVKENAQNISWFYYLSHFTKKLTLKFMQYLKKLLRFPCWRKHSGSTFIRLTGQYSEFI